jgi:ABC-type nitrate/sulfonate/bicarbonate transport system substrate-binding protein
VTTRRWARAHDATLVAYIHAYRESLAWTLAPEGRAAAITHFEEEFRLSPEAAAATYAALTDPADGLFRDAHIDVPGVQTAVDLRVGAGLLRPEPRPLTRYYDPTYLGRS